MNNEIAISSLPDVLSGTIMEYLDSHSNAALAQISPTMQKIQNQMGEKNLIYLKGEAFHKYLEEKKIPAEKIKLIQSKVEPGYLHQAIILMLQALRQTQPYARELINHYVVSTPIFFPSSFTEMAEKITQNNLENEVRMYEDYFSLAANTWPEAQVFYALLKPSTLCLRLEIMKRWLSYNRESALNSIEEAIEKKKSIPKELIGSTRIEAKHLAKILTNAIQHERWDLIREVLRDPRAKNMDFLEKKDYLEWLLPKLGRLGDVETLQLLIKIFPYDMHNWTGVSASVRFAFFRAAQYGHADFLSFFMKHPRIQQVIVLEGDQQVVLIRSAILMATMNGNLECLKLLLDTFDSYNYIRREGPEFCEDLDSVKNKIQSYCELKFDLKTFACVFLFLLCLVIGLFYFCDKGIRDSFYRVDISLGGAIATAAKNGNFQCLEALLNLKGAIENTPSHYLKKAHEYVHQHSLQGNKGNYSGLACGVT